MSVLVVLSLGGLRRERRQRSVERRPGGLWLLPRRMSARGAIGIRIVVSVRIVIVAGVEHHRRDVLGVPVPRLLRLERPNELILLLVILGFLRGHAHTLAPVRRHRPRLSLVRVTLQILVASVGPGRVRVVHVDIQLLVKFGSLSESLGGAEQSPADPFRGASHGPRRGADRLGRGVQRELERAQRRVPHRVSRVANFHPEHPERIRGGFRRHRHPRSLDEYRHRSLPLTAGRRVPRLVRVDRRGRDRRGEVREGSRTYFENPEPTGPASRAHPYAHRRRRRHVPAASLQVRLPGPSREEPTRRDDGALGEVRVPDAPPGVDGRVHDVFRDGSHRGVHRVARVVERFSDDGGGVNSGAGECLNRV